jgi:WhiB family redox-sensing transcriptional regulator
MKAFITDELAPISVWRFKGACLTADPELFFHPDQERGPARAAREAEAKKVCDRCPVIEQCAQWALATRQSYGVWGGLTEDERASLLRRRRRAGVAA